MQTHANANPKLQDAIRRFQTILSREQALYGKYDTRFNGHVSIVHEDGSSFALHHAFLWEPDPVVPEFVSLMDDFWYVVTEHNGDFVFYKNDITSIHHRIV